MFRPSQAHGGRRIEAKNLQLKYGNTKKIEGNKQEADDNPCQAKGEHVAHVMSGDARSRFSRRFNCRLILLMGHGVTLSMCSLACARSYEARNERRLMPPNGSENTVDAPLGFGHGGFLA
jgi:hypothetical protein